MPTDTEEAKLWQQFAASDKDAANKLVTMHLPLVRAVVDRLKRRLPECFAREDLFSSGLDGLWQAMQAFDVSRGLRFSTYAIRRIHGAILDDLRAMDWVPRLVRSRANKLAAATDDLAAKLGRKPTETELAAELQASPAELQEMVSAARIISVMSLERKWYDTDSHKEVREIDVLEDRRAESPAEHSYRLDFLRVALKSLSRDERILIILYYYEGVTMREIGRQIGRSESRVSQMHSELMTRLRDRFQSINLGKAYPKHGNETQEAN